MKRIYTLLMVLLCLLPYAHVSGKQSAVKDSLLRLYVNAPADTTRLDLIYQIGVLDQTTPTFIYYMDKLLKEAEAQGNILYQSAAIYSYIIYYYNLLDQKRTEYWLHKLEKLADENNFYLHYFRGQKMMTELYIMHQQTEFALDMAQDMYKKAEQLDDRNGMREACLCMMTGLFNIMQYKEGVEYLNRAFELLTPNATDITKIDLYTKAVLCYGIMHDNENMHRYLKELNEIRNHTLAKDPDAASNGYVNVFLFIDLEYALYYTRTNQPREARASLMEAEKYFSPTSFLPYQLIRLATYAEYYQSVKEYDKALESINQAIELAKPLSPDDAITYGFQKANILVEMDRADEALDVYSKVAKARDSISIAFSDSQMEQIQSLYDMDKLLRQQEERRAMFHRICISLATSILIVLIFINVHAYRGRKRLQHDEKEMRRLTQIAEDANEMKGRFLANMSYNVRISLNNVVGFSQLLSTDEQMSEEERKEYSSIIQAHSSQLIQLVNDVLDLSRLEANMMKYQMQECEVEEWANDIACMVPMRSEGVITLEMQAEATDARFNADTNKLTQMTMHMLLYPTPCKEPRTIRMIVTADTRKEHLLTCRIENSPMADPKFASQTISVWNEIHRLFFEHFGGIYQISSDSQGGSITFTYPLLP